MAETRTYTYNSFGACCIKGMSVKRLIELLSSFPPDMPVVTPDFDEGHFTPICVEGFVTLTREESEEVGWHLEQRVDGVKSLVLNFS